MVFLFQSKDKQTNKRGDENDLPLWERKVLTCDEAAAYSGIGIRRLRKMALAKGCPFAIANGTQILIAREKFDAYMDKAEKV